MSDWQKDVEVLSTLGNLFGGFCPPGQKSIKDVVHPQCFGYKPPATKPIPLYCETCCINIPGIEKKGKGW